MIREHADIAILGAGFAGSIAALVFERIGRRVVLVDRGTHPRFAIGESSTPSANLILEELSRSYDLPRLRPLCKYGRWQQSYPSLACGLKRGFSFFQHQPGGQFQATPDHANELLVGASPADEVADTHWFREHFDEFLVGEVQAAGIPYHDQTEIVSLEQDRGWRLRGTRGAEPVEITASLLIDATGPAGLLARTLAISTDPQGIGTNSWSIYTHFTGVGRWEDLLSKMRAPTTDYPYRCDDAALHHVLPDGWMWVLRFNQGVTSAGIAFDGERHPPIAGLSPEAEWQSVMQTYPSLARQFADSERIRPWVRTGRLQRLARRAAGSNWAMLPHAVYFLDPLFSAGNGHTLLGIQRLARILEDHANDTVVQERLADYERKLFREIEFLDWLVHGCYCCFGRFEVLSAYIMYYFAAAVQSEARLRIASHRGEAGFLASDDERLRAGVKQTYDLLRRSGDDPATARELVAELMRRVASDISPFNPAGFCDPAKRNMYPFA